MDSINIKELNEKIPNLKTLYEILTDSKGLYLPKFESHACTLNYLMKVIKDEKTFTITRDKITEPPIVKQNKNVGELMEIITEVLDKKKIYLGFDEEKMPNKDWLIKVLNAIEPKNPIFLLEEEIIKRQFSSK